MVGGSKKKSMVGVEILTLHSHIWLFKTLSRLRHHLLVYFLLRKSWTHFVQIWTAKFSVKCLCQEVYKWNFFLTRHWLVRDHIHTIGMVSSINIRHCCKTLQCAGTNGARAYLLKIKEIGIITLGRNFKFILKYVFLLTL